MRILMLGNSFTTANRMPELLARLTGAEVTVHARGGARLAEHLNPNTRMGGRTQAALKSGGWDYVVLQEMSSGPVTSPERFLKSTESLGREIRAAGAVPVLYITWAYQEGGERLASLGLSCEEMHRQMQASCLRAVRENGLLPANVGERFFESSQPPYAPDGAHPNELGSRLAAETLAETIRRDREERGR